MPLRKTCWITTCKDKKRYSLSYGKENSTTTHFESEPLLLTEQVDTVHIDTYNSFDLGVSSMGL